jgi:hypothetical protein
MRIHTIVLSGLACLLLGVAIPVALAQAPAPAPAPAPAGQPDAEGTIHPPGAVPLALPPPPLAHACLQLHNGGAVFNFNVTFNPNVTNFPIAVGPVGAITGNLCNAAQWHVTGGHLAPTLLITAARVAGPPCANQLTVQGNFASPSSYTGTYGFPGTGFTQHTLFLGYQKPTCP